jgi:hypothetical protein
MESRLGQKLSGTVKAIAERQRLPWRVHYVGLAAGNALLDQIAKVYGWNYVAPPLPEIRDQTEAGAPKSLRLRCAPFLNVSASTNSLGLRPSDCPRSRS